MIIVLTSPQNLITLRADSNSKTAHYFRFSNGRTASFIKTIRVSLVGVGWYT